MKSQGSHTIEVSRIEKSNSVLEASKILIKSLDIKIN